MMSESTLTYQVYVAPIIAMAGKDIPPGQRRSTWSPIAATLISGRHDAVLVDPLMTVEQGMAVATGKRPDPAGWPRRATGMGPQAAAITLSAAAWPRFQGHTHPGRAPRPPHPRRRQALRPVAAGFLARKHSPAVPECPISPPPQRWAWLPVGEAAPQLPPTAKRSSVPYSKQASELEPPYGIEP
jgi:hypothetical protein